ncbi:MAG: PAS domain-containing protein [Clostridia bacterium]
MNIVLLDALCRTAAALAEMFGRSCETVVHDFSNADCRIVAIFNGHVSGRNADSTDTIYGITISSLDCKEMIPDCDYVNTMVVTKDGRRIKTTSINYIGEGYHYVLGVNFDTSALEAADGVLRDLLSADGDFDNTTLADKKLSAAFDQCLAIVGKPIGKLTKRDRMQIVSILNNNGLFSVQKAVPYVSERFGMSRFTVYNYLNELKQK